MEQIEDRLELLGIAFGVFLVLVGLGTIVGQPWAQTTSITAGLASVVGALLSIGIGAGLVWLTRTETESSIEEPAETETA